MAITETQYSLTVQTTYYDRLADETTNKSKTFSNLTSANANDLAPLGRAYAALCKKDTADAYSTTKKPVDIS